MEQEGEGRGGGEENKQPQPQPQRQPPPPPPLHQVVQSLEELISPSPSNVVPSTSGGSDGDGVNKLLIGDESGGHQGPTSETQQLLDMYVLDYMKKRGMHNAAEIFREEAGVRNDPIEIDDPDGILKQWWSASFDAYVSSKMKNEETK